MINEFVQLAGQYSPAFKLINFYTPSILLGLYFILFLFVRNKAVFILMAECLLFLILNKLILNNDPFLYLALSSLIYCTCIYIFSKINYSIVSASFVFILISLVIMFLIDSNLELKSLTYELTGEMSDYLIYDSAYALKEFYYYVYNIMIIPIINALIVFGLIRGKGGMRGYNNNDRLTNTYDVYGYGSIYRFKKNIHRCFQRIKRTEDNKKT